MQYPVTVLLTGCVLLWASSASDPVRAERSALPGLPSDATDADETVVRVTAVVTDSKGRTVPGLEPADFELLVDGQPQTVDTAELASAGGSMPRAVAFLLDEFHTHPDDSGAVRDGLLRFIDRHLRPADLAVVVKPLDPLTAIVPTTDRTAVRQAIATFAGRKGNYEPRTAFERDYMAQAPAAVASARAQIVTSALRAIGVSLAGTQGSARPAIVLVSDGFGRSRTSRDTPANLQAAIRILNRADAPVYAFAPALLPPVSGGTDGIDPAFAALTALTAQTGGHLYAGPGRLEPGLSLMARDLDAHYVLTYRAAHGSDGRFHSLTVGLRRDGAHVRARTGYVALEPPARRAAARSTPAPARILRRSALIQSWSGFSPTVPGHGTVTVTWEPAVPRSDAAVRGRASTIVVTASTPDGTRLFDATVAPAGGPRADVPNAAMFEAPLGPIRLDMKILDAAGVVIDTDARDITVPTVRKDAPIIYTPAILRTRSAREFREASTDMHAAPAASRDFRRTERLILRVPAVDSAGSPIAVTALLLNRWRQPMRSLAPLEGRAPQNTTQFDLPLAPLAPGEYSVRLTVAGPAGTISEFVSFRVQG